MALFDEAIKDMIDEFGGNSEEQFSGFEKYRKDYGLDLDVYKDTLYAGSVKGDSFIPMEILIKSFLWDENL